MYHLTIAARYCQSQKTGHTTKWHVGGVSQTATKSAQYKLKLQQNNTLQLNLSRCDGKCEGEADTHILCATLEFKSCLSHGFSVPGS